MANQGNGDLLDVEHYQLLQQLDSSATQENALASLAAANWKKDHATSLRLAGHIPTLIHLIENSSTVEATLQHVLKVLLAAAELDTLCKEALIKGGAVRKLCKLLDPAALQHGQAAVLLSVRLLHQCINSGDIAREPAIDEIFRVGAASRAAKFLESDDIPLASAAGSLFWEVTDIPAFRERCRDLGIVPTVLKLLSIYPDAQGYMGFINNLSRSEALHLTLQEHGVIDVMGLVLNHTTLEVNRIQAVITVANVYAGREGHEQSEQLLSKCNASASLMTMMDTCLHGDCMFGGAWWALEEVVQAVQSLSQKPQHAEKLWKVGCVDLLIEVLTSRGADSDAIMQACRAIANMTSVQTLKGRMFQKKELLKAVQVFESSEDLRVQDVAKGALLKLGALKDQGALAADSALCGDDRDYQQKYDVFLSHKRTDSKDFARALYNLLVLRAYKTFLDYEYREELSDLGKIVSNSENLVFIMTDNIFDSPWCIKELQAAVEAKINIILLVKEGSRWKNEEGLKVCEFPGSNILGKLPAELQQVFTRKALYHSDEYYQTFVDMLIKKIVRPCSNQAPASSESSSLPPSVPAVPAASHARLSEVAHLFTQRTQPNTPQGAPTPAAAPLYGGATTSPWALQPSAAAHPAPVPVQAGIAHPSMYLPLQQQTLLVTNATDWAGLIQADVATVRQDMLQAIHNLRREHAHEIYQLKLDFSQQLQQLRRESNQLLLEILHRVGGPLLQTSTAGLGSEASASHVAAGDDERQVGLQRQVEVMAAQLQRLTDQFQLQRGQDQHRGLVPINTAEASDWGEPARRRGSITAHTHSSASSPGSMPAVQGRVANLPQVNYKRWPK